ncbi:MAG: hypothetical protein HY778_14420 [Betaproteobacteria bacterium]|nr:hypothetical protein [Betaproteobacteria bacterium]
MLRPIFLLPLALLALSGCERLGIADPAKTAAAADAEAKAVGAGCRNAGRGIQDCYNLNPAAAKAMVFAGWKEMNDYMTENKLEPIESVVPQPPPPPPPGAKTKKNAGDEETAEKPAEDAGEHAPRKPRAGKKHDEAEKST